VIHFNLTTVDIVHSCSYIC